jgi:PAS domain-containing protein
MHASLTTFKPCDLPTPLSSLQSIAALLDTLSDVVFFIKDSEARYAFANQALARRCGFKHTEELLGRTADMVFTERYGPLYTEQDRRVLCSGTSWPTSSNCTPIMQTSPSGA